MYLRLFAHLLVGFLIGALYYDIGNDGAKVLSNLGFLFFNMLFLMYTSMTITILSCKYKKNAQNSDGKWSPYLRIKCTGTEIELN